MDGEQRRHQDVSRHDRHHQWTVHVIRLVIFRDGPSRQAKLAISVYLGVTHVEQYDYPAGRNYLEKALRLVQATGDRALEARIENALGYASAGLGNLSAALTHHQRSRQISQQIGDPF